MAVTLADMITNVRSNLEEPSSTSATFWTDSELTVWINNACKDIARRAEVIQSYYTAINAVVGQNKYALPSNVIRLHRVEFAPTGQTQIYPLQISTEQEMDNVWGLNPNSQSSYPMFCTIWGTPGVTETTSQLQLRVYPTPSTAGVFNIYYYRLPYRFITPLPTLPPLEQTKVVEIPEGWDDLVVLYCEYEAKRKDRNQSWKDTKDLYEEKLNQMVEQTRQWHDQAQSMQTPNSYLPAWLYSFEGVDY
jgi:hypothetical protein